MTLAFAAFTRRGEALARRLAEQLGGSVTRIDKENPLPVWTAQQFSEKEGLVFVGAVGIAVRAIAPHLRHKTTDPAVVAVDEGGRFAIPLVSGHLGGANALAQAIAAHLGAIPVITTATDSRGLFAVDSWANAQGCLVKEPERIKWVSSKVLDGKPIQLRCPWPISGEKPDEVSLTQEEACDAAVTLYQEENTALHLLPKALTLGVGCRDVSGGVRKRLRGPAGRAEFRSGGFCSGRVHRPESQRTRPAGLLHGPQLGAQDLLRGGTFQTPRRLYPLALCGPNHGRGQRL